MLSFILGTSGGMKWIFCKFQDIKINKKRNQYSHSEIRKNYLGIPSHYDLAFCGLCIVTKTENFVQSNFCRLNVNLVKKFRNFF